jgi:DNA-directed RNA polymerase subunit M/transcription elongation factor TFIIS
MLFFIGTKVMETPMSSHFHRCVACKHIWRHDPKQFVGRKRTEASIQKAMDAAHVCPNCGSDSRGNFRYYNPRSLKEMARLNQLPLTQPKKKEK